MLKITPIQSYTNMVKFLQICSHICYICSYKYVAIYVQIKYLFELIHWYFMAMGFFFKGGQYQQETFLFIIFEKKAYF